MSKAFNGNKNHFILTFTNGNSISSIWGWGSYTENYGGIMGGTPDFEKAYDSNDVEVMVSCGDKLFRRLQKRYDTSNTVFGNIDITEWLWLVNKVSKEATDSTQMEEQDSNG